MDNYKFISHTEEQTMELAQNIESEKFPNMIICLKGELGSGKTLFVKGFAKSLGVNETITSPTFTIVKEYEDGEMPLYHMDVYRLENVEEDNVGIIDYFNKGGVTIIEWSDLIENLLPEERLELKFKITSENSRIITITPYGKKYENLIDLIL